MTDELNQQYKTEIRKQAVQQAAKWTLAGAIALILFAATGWWLYLKPKIDNYIVSASDSIPSGAVVAFESSESETCPGRDWKLFEPAKGRFIIGAGHGDRSKLTPRQLGDTGGEESVTLTIPQIPAHSHSTVQMIGDNNIDGVDSTTVRSGDHHNETRETDTTGENQPHNNIPPFLALYYCKKE